MDQQRIAPDATPVPPVRQRRADSERVRQLLIQAAITQLAEHGMNGLTHRRVEQVAGASQGSVRYHFGNKDGLIYAVLEDSVAEVVALNAASVARFPSDGTPEELTAAFMAAARLTFDALRQDPTRIRARYELFLHASTKPALQEYIRQARQRICDSLASVFPDSYGQQAGRMLMAVTDGLLLHQMSGYDDTVDAMVPLLMVATLRGAQTLDQALPCSHSPGHRPR